MEVFLYVDALIKVGLVRNKVYPTVLFGPVQGTPAVLDSDMISEAG